MKSISIGLFFWPMWGQIPSYVKTIMLCQTWGTQALVPLLQHLLTAVPWWVTGICMAPECYSFAKGPTWARYAREPAPSSPNSRLELSPAGRVSIMANKAFPLCSRIWLSKLFHGHFLISFSPRSWESGQMLLLLSSLSTCEGGGSES